MLPLSQSLPKPSHFAQQGLCEYQRYIEKRHQLRCAAVPNFSGRDTAEEANIFTALFSVDLYPQLFASGRCPHRPVPMLSKVVGEDTNHRQLHNFHSKTPPIWS
jgi:hypothetical protein